MPFLVIILFIAAVLVFMAVGAFTVATAGAMFLDHGFWDGWHAAWNRPGYLLLFAVITSAFPWE